MKTIRIDFSKGTNSKVDPRLLGEGTLLVADNTETRSGVLKPVTAPEFVRSVPEGTARIFEFRGKWYFSPTWRDYAAAVVGTQERVLFAEPGGIPQKIVDGVQARLGIVPPSGIPVVTLTDSIIPQNIRAVDGPVGGLEPGGYGYRLGLRTKTGRLQPSSTIIGNVKARPNGDKGSVTLSWDAPTLTNLATMAGIEDLNGDADITAIVIYGRTAGQERVMIELSPDSTDYTDNGGSNPSGATASGYDSKAPMRYFFTFEREVGGHVDESGPSVMSSTVDSDSARLITFSETDGIANDPCIKHRNLYRIGDVALPALVARIPLTRKDEAGNTVPVTQYLDCAPLDALGDGPDSEYDDEDGQHVVFAPAPMGLKRLTPHYGMMFGIHGSTVRGTPVNRPDAWPDAYTWPLPFPPVNLASFGGALIILAQDALYRLDGGTPGSMSLTRMPIEDGCIAPFSVQSTPGGLIYLSARGLMLYQGGMVVEPLTEKRLDSRILLAPSTPKVEWPFWWLPTKYGQPFAAQTRDLVTLDENDASPALADTRVIEGPIEEIRSWCFGNRYYLTYVGDDYGANTTFCVDLGEPGMPITTLGVRPLDVHVTAMEHCYMLLPDFKASSAAYRIFREAQVNVDQTLGEVVAPITGRMLARYGKGRDTIPWYIRTGPMSQGAPVARKRYRYLECHGRGLVDMRVYVDGRIVARAQVTATETPSHARKLNLPRSTRGYALDLEAAGDADLFGLELTFDPMPSES